MDLNKLTMGDKIVAGAGLGLIISLLFFPWHSFDSGFGPGFTRTGIQSPNAFLGILALLLTIALVGVVLAQKLGNVDLPDLPVPWADAKFYAAIAVLVLLVIKLLMEMDVLGFGSYFSILLAGGMTYGGFLIKQEGAGATSTPPSSF